MAYTRVNWEDLPSTNTPRNATNLNKMDAGIKDNDDRIKENEDKLLGTKPMGSIVVDDINCKNLFNKNNVNKLNAYFNESTQTITSNSSNRTLYIPCKPNTTYTITIPNTTGAYAIGYTSSLPALNTSVSGVSNTLKTITTDANAKYLVMRYFQTAQATITEQQALDSIQIEVGSEATPYTPYKNFDSTIEKLNVTSSYTLNVQGCFARGDEININLNVFNDSSYSTGSWVEIAQLPSGYYPNGERYLSAFGCGSGWNTPISVPILITSNGKINVYIVTSNIKRIVVSGSFLKTL